MNAALASTFVVLTVALATALQPWRMLRGRARCAAAAAGLALALGLALLPTVAVAGIELRWSGAALLVLVAGWPLAVLALAAATLVALALGTHAADTAFALLCWHGLLPAWWALAGGWAVRRWLPRNPFVYIFCRAFVVTTAGVVGLGLLRSASGDAALAQLLLGFAEGTLTGMLVAALVAMRPELLATYSDRLWAPTPGDCRTAPAVLPRWP